MGSAQEGKLISARRIKSPGFLSLFNIKEEDADRVIVNESIVDAWRKMVRRDINPADFMFRQKCIELGIASFGDIDFTRWIYDNLNSPGFTHQHARFVSDTIRFITTGKRELPVQTWDLMISVGANDPYDRAQIGEEELALLGCRSETELLNDKYLVTCIAARWISHPGGFSDFLGTLNIFFGDKV
jgi:hypothetical protein